MDDIEQMLGVCESVSDVTKRDGGPGFSPWELEFLESVREQFDERGRLSDHQTEILTELYDRS